MHAHAPTNKHARTHTHTHYGTRELLVLFLWCEQYPVCKLEYGKLPKYLLKQLEDETGTLAAKIAHETLSKIKAAIKVTHPSCSKPVGHTV